MFNSIESGRRRALMLQCERRLYGVPRSPNLGDALAVPSSHSRRMPCSQCHTLSFGPALTDYGRQFQVERLQLGDGELTRCHSAHDPGRVQSRGHGTAEAPAAHFSTNTISR